MAINFGRGGLLGYGGGGFSPPWMQKAPPMNGGVMPNIGRPPPNLGSPPPWFSPVPTQPLPGFNPQPGFGSPVPGEGKWGDFSPNPYLRPQPAPKQFPIDFMPPSIPDLPAQPAPQQRMMPWGGSNIYNPIFRGFRPTR